METKYIRFNHEQALNAKKQFLSAELNILQTAKKVKNYKILRKREVITKTKLKTALRNLKTKINVLQSTFPEQEMPEPSKKKEKKIKKKQEQDIQEQLQEIQEKLARLQ